MNADSEPGEAVSILEDMSPSAGRSALHQLGLSAWDATALTAALLLVVAFFPTLMFESWSPRMAVLLGFGAVGVAVLGTLALRRDVAAMLLTAALGWTVVVSAVSDAPRSALLGVVGRDLSGLVVTLSAGMWALGRLTSPNGRNLLMHFLVWALTVNGLVGLLQFVLDVDTGPLALLYGRPTGFDTNPVYFGGLCAAGVAVAQSKWVEGWRAMAFPVVILGACVSVSGSRVALAAVVITAIAIAGTSRSRSALAALGAVVTSLALGVVLDRVKGADVNAVGRLGETSSDGRFTAWRYGVEAWGDRPLTGYGFGQFRPAVQGRFSTKFVRLAAPDEITQAWFDPHNLGVALLVSVGVIGALLFTAWAVYWGWSTRGPLLWAVIALVLHWMLQPMSLFTLPVAMLAFGASSRRAPDLPPSRPSVTRVSIALGAFAGVGLLAGDLLLRSAVDDVDGPRAEAVARWFGADPIVADIVAQVYSFDADAPDRQAKELEWRTRVTQYEPDRPLWWSSLALLQIRLREFEHADASIERAYELQPHNTRTLRAEMVLAAFEGDVERLARALDDACDLGMGECGTAAKELLAEIGAEVPDSSDG